MELRTKERIERAEKISLAKLERANRDKERKEARLAKEEEEKQMELRIRESEIEEIKRDAQKEQERIKKLALIHREKIMIADEFYRRTLTCEYGLSPWMKFVAGCRKDALVSMERYKSSLVKRSLRLWLGRLNQKWNAEETRAIDYSNSLIHKNFLNTWQRIKKRMNQMEKISDYTYQTSLMRNVLAEWAPRAISLRDSRLEREMKQTIRANALHSNWLVKRVMRSWTQFVVVSREERWSEWKKDQMRQKVKALLSKSRLGSDP
jgi:hypothetical protein